MNTSHLRSTAHDIRRAWRLLAVGVGLLAFFGLAWADSTESFACYALVTAASVLPSALWIRAGMPGIPVLPAVAAFHYLYFAVPILRQNFEQGAYAPWEILRAAATVAVFLVVATLASPLIRSASIPRSRRAAADFTSSVQTVLFGGIAVGVLFHVLLMSGWLTWLGPYLGVVRSVAITGASIACYLVGYCRARGLLRRRAWILALAGMVLMIVLSWSSLFLVGGMTFALAAVLGYVITAKRIPWRALGPLAVAVFILHAGKMEMREQYWIGGYGRGVAIEQVPGLMTEWLGDGLGAIATGDAEDVINRASLLYMLLRVQQLTPDYIPYLGGETYALLPSYLVPRFVDPNKTISQAGVALLNIRYGIQTEDNRTTTIGWGIIAEAFANFGYGGVLGVGFLFGALAAVFTRWSAGASPLALPTLLSVAALMSMINLEADFGYLVVNLWQALAATLMLFVPLKFLSGSEKRRPPARALAAPR